MRILQVTPAYPPSAFGGMSTHVGLLSTELSARGHDVWVATTNGYDFKHAMPFSGSRRLSGVSVYYAKSYRPRRYFFAPEIFLKLTEWIPTFDVIHVHDPRSFVALAAYVVARKSTVPYVVTCHGSINARIGNTLLKELHDHIVGKGLVKSAARAIPFEPKGGFDEAQVHKGVGRGTERTVLYLGRIHPIKGIDRLIDAFAAVVAQNEKCRLIVVGQDYGAQRGLERRVKDHGLNGKVSFPGPKYGDEKDEIFRQADVFVLPSYVETFPLVVLEALAAGIPVVATEACGISDELRINEAALIVDSTDEMTQAIESCLYEPLLVERLRANGFRLLETTYNWKRVIDRVSEIYQQVIA